MPIEITIDETDAKQLLQDIDDIIQSKLVTIATCEALDSLRRKIIVALGE